MKKLLSLVLALCMIFACAQVVSAETTYPLDASNEPIIIYRTVESNAPNLGYANYNETEFVKEWIAKTGINVEFKEFADNAAIVLALASGAYPDAVMAYEGYYNGGLPAMIEEELAINLMDYAEYMPNYLATLELDPSYRPYVTHDDGGIYFMANLISSDNIVSSWRGMVVRQDILDKLGAEIPTTNDEFYNLLVRMRDELGMTAPLAGNWWSSVLFNDGFASTEYGLVNGVGYQVDGKYEYGAYKAEYREYLRFINKLYTEGLLDPNFMTADEATTQASLLNGQTGFHPTSGARINTITNRATDENFQLAGLGSLNGSDGTKALFSQADSKTPDRVNLYITADCEQPELVVQFFDWLYSEEGIIMSNWGVEDLCWTWDENGERTFTDYMKANDKGLSLDQMMYVYGMTNSPALVIKESQAQRFAMEEQLDAMARWNDSQVATYALPPYAINDTELKEEATNLWTDISTYISECRVKFITGEMNLDGDFDAYLAQLKTMGMDRYIEIQQIGLDAYYAKVAE